MIRGWARRTAELHGELAELADFGAHDPRWWLVAGGTALPWGSWLGPAGPSPRSGRGTVGTYVASDAEPASDTFIGHAADEPVDVVAYAIARAHAARAALRELDGQLPDQPLAVTVRRTATGAVAEPSKLDVAAFAVGDRIVHARLADHIADEHELVSEISAELALGQPASGRGSGRASWSAPFVTVSLGSEPIETARHGHRRGWAPNGDSRGPWLGLGRAGGLDVVSTCHMIIDGYGHAWLAARVAAHLRRLLPDAPGRNLRAPPLAAVAGTIPLGVAWRPLAMEPPRALPLAYALGRLLHRVAGRPGARFSPTFQIPVAPGVTGDPARGRQRVVPAIVSVRFVAGAAEPFEIFAARARAILGREALGAGLSAQLLAAARGAPAPLAWKRRAVGSNRPSWLDPVAGLIGGRGCVSRLRLGVPTPPSCAVSSPARLATPTDPVGGCVVTVIDDTSRGAMTLCGSGLAGTAEGAAQLLEQLLALIP